MFLLCIRKKPFNSNRRKLLRNPAKSGDSMLPQNYRPICIIPLLYKLFSKLLYKRLYPILDKAQCADQAGFRNKFSTIDHMFVCTMVFEKSEEFQLNSCSHTTQRPSTKSALIGKAFCKSPLNLLHAPRETGQDSR